MNDKLHALTTESIEFLCNIGGNSIVELLPPGTPLEIDPHEMESNPNFFHATLANTGGRVHSYISRAQITPV